MNNTTKWLVNAAAIIVIALGLKAAAPLITQVLIILFLAIIISPVYYFLRRLRFPSWLALTALIAVISLVCLCIVGYAAPKAAVGFGKDIPEYARQLTRAAQEARVWLHENNIEVPDAFYNEITSIDTAAISKYTKQTGAITANFFKAAVFVVIIVCFILCELPHLPDRARKFAWMTDGLWGRLSAIVVDVRRYMGIKTVVSALTGFFVYLGLLALGVSSPLLLGLLAFIMNFVPFIGSILAAVPAVMLALAQQDAAQGVYTALWYLLVNMILGNVMEPKLMGRGFGVSPVIVLVSLVFWGWALGPVGMFFAVPLTMAARGAVISVMEDEKAA
jgi:predicted PurR-regulated permease PerM